MYVLKSVFLKLKGFYETKKKREFSLQQWSFTASCLVEMQQNEPEYVKSQCKSHNAAAINM